MKILIVLMAYLNMNAEVVIGDIVLPHINSFKVEQSIQEISDKATVTIAKNYRELKGQPVLKYIQAGYPVEIKAGYNGNYLTEFKGFVKPGIDSEWPIQIECDELFLLRQGNIVLSYNQITLKQLLATIAPAYKIECPDSQLGKMLINNRSPFQVLNELKKRFGFYSRIDDNILSVGWAYDFRPGFTKNHIYTIGKNVKDAKGLQFKTDIDFNVRVEAVLIIKGKKHIITSGSKDKDAKVKKIDVNQHMTEADVKKIADAQLHKILYAGFTGNIVGFGYPQTKAGDSLTIINPLMQERNGTYMIEKVEVEYAPSHINRTNTLSYKIV